MRWAKLISILSILVIISFSCKKNSYPIEPQLNYLETNTPDAVAGVQRNIQLTFAFSDGDGDIGYNKNDSTTNIFFIDKRFDPDSLSFRFQFPEITADNNPEKGVKGEFYVDIDAGFLLKRTDTMHTDFDTMVWDVYIVDQAGHKSNVVETAPLILY
jgi:hypothetical protein